jgi:hypothetical protein
VQGQLLVQFEGPQRVGRGRPRSVSRSNSASRVFASSALTEFAVFAAPVHLRDTTSVFASRIN